MIYIVSGASRSGKTMLARRILAARGVTYLSLDWLVMGFTNGMPECGIHDLLFPDDIARRIWKFVRAMLESMMFIEEDCVVEGEAVLPELIAELIEKHPKSLRACFVGYADIAPEQKFADIKSHSAGETDWLLDKPDEYIADHVKNMIAHSNLIRRSCAEHGLHYVETSTNFESALDESIAYLLRPAP